MSWFRRRLPWLFGLILLINVAGICHAEIVTLSWDPSPTPEVTGYRALVLTEEVAAAIPTLRPYEIQDLIDAGVIHPVLFIDGELTVDITGLDEEVTKWFCVQAYVDKKAFSSCSNIVHRDGVVAALPDLFFNIKTEVKK